MDHQSPFRHATLSCPRCARQLSSGEPSFCARCDGAWISEQALVERVATMQRAPAQIEWSTESRTAISCTVCDQPMTALVVFGVPIDRCRPHGFWFDRAELAQVLYASSLPARPETRPIADDTEWSGVAYVGGDFAPGAISGTLEVAGDVLDATVAEAASAGVDMAGEVAGVLEAGVAEAASEGVGAVLEASGEVAGSVLGAIAEALADLL